MPNVSVMQLKVFQNTEQLKLSLEWNLQAVSNRCEYANLAHSENESKLEIFMDDDVSGLPLPKRGTETS